MAKSKSKAVVKKNSTLPASPINYEKDANRGMEGADKDSYAIPFIAMLQPLSPQAETIKGAKAGMFLETVSGAVYNSLKVIPCAFQRRYLRWVPRAEGGGYKGQYLPSDVETGKIKGVEPPDDSGTLHIEGDELRDTRLHYVLFQDINGVWKPAIISLGSTQIKKSKRWMSLIRGIELTNTKGKVYTPPSFSHIYALTPVKEENNKGSWWGINVEVDSQVTDVNVYNAAKVFNEEVHKGTVIAAEPTPEAEEAF